MTHATMSAEEENERKEALAEVTDPMFLMRGEGEADAEGDIEPTDDGGFVPASTVHPPAVAGLVAS